MISKSIIDIAGTIYIQKKAGRYDFQHRLQYVNSNLES